MGSLEGMRIIVGGGGGGIVSAWCRYFAAQGAKVLVNDIGFMQSEELGGDYDLRSRSRQPADDVVRDIVAAGGTAVADYQDLSDFNAARLTVDHCIEAFGGVDAVVNGTCVSRLGECHLLSPEDFDAVLKNNLYPDYNLTHHALPYMMDQGWGRLIYTNSTVIRSFWGSVNYAAAYGGVYSLMRCMANEGRQYGITANCVEPTAAGKTGARPAGIAYLDRRAKALGLDSKPAAQTVSESIPAEATAPFVGYLLSEEGGWISGQNFAVRGGRIALYSTFEESACAEKALCEGDWTFDELKKTVPEVFAGSLVKLWYDRDDQKKNE